MNKLLRFNLKYCLLAIIIFVIEVLIALYVHDEIIRPYVGDTLVVMLLYCILKSFLNIPAKKAALGVLIFAYLIEISQYYNFIEILGLQDSKFASTIMGTSFAWIDVLAYTIGYFLIILIEAKNEKN